MANQTVSTTSQAPARNGSSLMRYVNQNVTLMGFDRRGRGGATAKNVQVASTIEVTREPIGM